jgi:hypothetical protein
LSVKFAIWYLFFSKWWRKGKHFLGLKKGINQQLFWGNQKILLQNWLILLKIYKISNLKLHICDSKIIKFSRKNINTYVAPCNTTQNHSENLVAIFTTLFIVHSTKLQIHGILCCKLMLGCKYIEKSHQDYFTKGLWILLSFFFTFSYERIFEWNLLQLIIKNTYSYPNRSHILC